MCGDFAELMSKANKQRAAILVVDDDPDMRLILRRCFESAGFVVIEAENAEQLADRLAPEVELITLDLKLQNDDGLAIARQVRTWSDLPIIMVTGKDEPVDRIVGLEVGADDYITKPFHIREVLARVRTVLRRARKDSSRPRETMQPASQCFSFGEWVLDLEKCELRCRRGNSYEITLGQLKLLGILINNRSRVLSRNQIMDLLGGADWTPNDRSIDNRIAGLRRIIEADPKNPQFIKTVRGMGYRFDGDVKVV